MSANPIKQAEKIIKAYAEDLKGLQFEECNDLGFSDNQCINLMRVLGKGKEGEVTSDERIVLERLRFAKDFIDTLAGADGKKALQARAKWLQSVVQSNSEAIWKKKVAIEELIKSDANAAATIFLPFVNSSDWDNVLSDDAIGIMITMGAAAFPALANALASEDHQLQKNAAAVIYFMASRKDDGIDFSELASVGVSLLEKMASDTTDPNLVGEARLALDALKERLR